MDPPETDLEYFWVVDGTQEKIVDNEPADWSYIPVNDWSSYANRKWAVGSGDVTVDIYDSCHQIIGNPLVVRNL